MAKASHANEILDEMVRIMGFPKAAGDVAAEFKAKLAAAPTEAAIDALYAEYRGQLKWAPNQEDWEALINARKGQLRSAKASADTPALRYALAYLVEIADALDKYGCADVANIVDETIGRLSAYKTE